LESGNKSLNFHHPLCSVNEKLCFLNIKTVQRTHSVIGQLARCMRPGRPWGPCSSCLATCPVRGASIANELSGLLVFFLQPLSLQTSSTVLDDWWHLVGIEEVHIYRGVLCCCLACMPLRIQDVSACLIQELLCLENGGYTIHRNLLGAYQITLSECIAAAALPHIFVTVWPGYRRLEVQMEQNEVSFCPLFPGFRKSILY
jgi:hypothetical protein